MKEVWWIELSGGRPYVGIAIECVSQKSDCLIMDMN